MICGLINQYHALPNLLWILFLAVFIFAITALLAISWYRNRNLYLSANAIDKAARLEDRTLSALDFSRRSARNWLMDLAIADSESKLKAIELSKIVRILPERMGWKVAATALAMILSFVVLSVDLTGILPNPFGKTKTTPGVSVPADTDQARQLPSAAIPPLLSQVIKPLRDYMASLRQRISEVASIENEPKMEANRPPETAPEMPETIFKEFASNIDLAKLEAIEALPPVSMDGKMHLSDISAMGFNYEADGLKAEAFKGIDELLFGDEAPELSDVEKYVDSLKADANQRAVSAEIASLGGSMALQTSARADEIGAHKNNLKSVQNLSFQEFLHDYAAHLQQMIEAKKDILDQKNAEDQRNKQKNSQSALNQPAPQDMSNMKMVTIDPAEAKKMQLNPIEGTLPPNAVTANMMPSTSKAGKGGGTETGSIKVEPVDQASGESVKLTGMTGEGMSSVQILENLMETTREDFSKEAYRQIYKKYEEQTEGAIEDQQLPPTLQSYVREYFLSLNPDSLVNIKK